MCLHPASGVTYLDERAVGNSVCKDAEGEMSARLPLVNVTFVVPYYIVSKASSCRSSHSMTSWDSFNSFDQVAMFIANLMCFGKVN
jgi:hypothetical protein